MQFDKPTLDCVLRTISKEYADRNAIIFEDTYITYTQVFQYSSNLALNLRKLGLKKGDKVAVILPNCLEYLYVFFALFQLGAWVVPISTRYEADELRNIIKDSDACMIIHQDIIGVFDYNQLLFGLKDELPLLDNFVVLSDGELQGKHSLRTLISEVSAVRGNLEAIIDESIQPDDVALLAYTSGTTGSPKGVMISHKCLVLTSYHCAKLWELENDVAFSVAPLYAAQGFLAILIDLVAGATMKWISSFNPNDIASQIIKKDVTVFHTQPTMWSILLTLPYFKMLNLKHIKKVVVSGSLCSYELAKKIQESTDCTLLNAYGLIEATGVTTLTQFDDPEDIRLGTVGGPIPGVEIRIVDSERQDLPKGETGELAVRGYLMNGYYKNKEKTKEIIDAEGWLYTGDLACYHEDGENIRIVGRCKDMVIRGGFNVYPIDIEECLLKFEKIEDVSVVGSADSILGEKLVAFVIPKPGVSITPGEVMGFCRGKIANYKVPDEVYFVSQFPILLSGKVQKNVLVQWTISGIPEDSCLLFGD